MTKYFTLLLITACSMSLSLAMEQPAQTTEARGIKRAQPEGSQVQQPVAKDTPKWQDWRHLQSRGIPHLGIPPSKTGYDFRLFTGSRYIFGMDEDGSLFLIRAMPLPMKITRLHKGSNVIADEKGRVLVGVSENNVIRIQDMTNPAAPYTLNLGVTPVPVKDPVAQTRE